MRIGTKWLNDQGIATMLRQQADLVQSQQRISSGRKAITPADDPVAAAQVIRSGQAQFLNDRYIENQSKATSRLNLAESTLAGINDLYHDARTLLVSAGNATFSDAERKALAGQLQSLRDQLLGMANATDGAGGYLFSGHSESVQPFVSTAAGVVYQGDQGQRQLQVSASRQVEVSDNGAELFERVRNGNGVFVTAASAANMGAAAISVGGVSDPAALTGHDYRIDFSVAAGVTTYSVFNVTLGASVSTGNPYASGASIVVAGMQARLEGAPANGDSFTLAPSTNQSSFSTLDGAIRLLNAPMSSPAGAARLGMGLAQAIAGLDQALDRSIGMRAGIGARLAELDTLGDYSASLGLRHGADLSAARDVDLAAAISEFTRGQQALEASQKSYLRLAQISVFDLI